MKCWLHLNRLNFCVRHGPSNHMGGYLRITRVRSFKYQKQWPLKEFSVQLTRTNVLIVALGANVSVACFQSYFIQLSAYVHL